MTAPGAEELIESQAPIPPRYRWLKFFGKASIVVIVLMIALRVAWGWEARRRLEAIDPGNTRFDPPQAGHVVAAFRAALRFQSEQMIRARGAIHVFGNRSIRGFAHRRTRRVIPSCRGAGNYGVQPAANA
jgi:hypothetical protein